ncbi:DUF4190 domain-containing protein [Rothia sp. ARF10]|nr:DUF4190 domain-containing protein [Rothia sp. ARF10]
MSENDKDPQQGEYSDPTASPDWAVPSSSPDAGSNQDTPSSAPTEQIPQGSDADRGSSSDEPYVPPVPPAPPTPSYDAPYAQPAGETDPYAGGQPANPYAATPPPPPQSPYGSAQPPSPYGAPPPPPAYGAPQAQDPYAGQQPAYDPYAASGAQAQPGGYPPYQPPGQWQAPPVGYGAPPAQNTSAIVLTILSGIVTVSCCIPGIVPLILGIMALTKNSTDPEGSRRLTKWGWIAFAVGIALAVIGFVIFIAIGASGGFDGGTYDSDYSY